MVSQTILLIIAFFCWEVQSSTNQENCREISTPGRSLNLSIRSKRNDTGEWMTKFSVWKETKTQPDNISLDVNQKVMECNGKHVVFIQGVLNEVPFELSNESLSFHPNCGKNAAISDDGRSAQKINTNDPLNGVVLTNRPLKNNELFEIRFDKKNSKYSYFGTVGVTIYSPDTFNIPDHIYNVKSGNWMYYHNQVYTHGAVSVDKYGRNINELVAGDRIGVLRNNYGTLHFFINGVDQGPAASHVPYPVYGVFELYYNAVKGTIVDHSSTSTVIE